MTITEEIEHQEIYPPCMIMDLPDDVIYTLFGYCDMRTLGRLACVCLRLSQLIRQDCVWLRWKRRMTCVEQSHASRHGEHLPIIREQCRIACNWKEPKCNDFCTLHHSFKLQPWMVMDDESQLWISYANTIRCYRKSDRKAARARGSVSRLREVPKSRRSMVASSDDVCRFVCKDGIIVSGSREGTLTCFNTSMTDVLSCYTRCHAGDIHCVDVTCGDTAITGSRDATVKIWRLHQNQSEAALHSISTGDRVWSLAVSPDGRSLVTGTAGINESTPLKLWDLERVQILGTLGGQYKRGAGVLDINFDSRSTLLTCGYDTFVRLWDLRLPLSKCVSFWEEPYDSALYCVRSNGGNAFVVGTSRHGMVRLWDKRKLRPVQMYYVGRYTQSPVYSLAFDSTRLFVGVDIGIHVLNFS